jgi:4'-phosphopantetheinyl transferase EntD
MIETILPSAVVAVEAFEDVLDAPLFPAEEHAVGGAVARRRKEFTTVRACARTALAGLGLPPSPIVPGARGAPGWPDGVVGSMTHCAGYCAAALARASDVATIGLDAERHEVLPDGVLDAIALPGEQVRLTALAADAPSICWDRLLFSAKEAVYKAWFPLTGRWLDFSEADITVDPEAGTFAARLLVAGPCVDGRPLTSFPGRWLARDGLVMTAVVLSRDHP